MKLTVENLGRIRRAELDIRPLTVFAGENGTNKTWTAYSLFALLQALRLQHRWETKLLESPPQLGEAVARSAREVKKLLGSLPGDGAGKLLSSRRDFFAWANPGEELRFSLPASAISETVAASVADGCRASVSFEKEEFLAGPATDMDLRLSATTMTAQYFREGSERSLLSWTQSPRLVEEVFWHFALSRFRWVQCLPAERKLLAQIYPAILNPKQDTGRALARPLLDFAMTMQIGAAGLFHDNPWLRRLAVVVGGAYGKDGMGAGALQFTPVSGAALPLSGSASLVKSLVGLALFLQEAHRGDVLFIDEPEMNAHPRAQAALMELLAMLVNEGIHVVLTTHSPYFVDHLTNLIEGSTLAPEKQEELGKHLYLKDRSALLKAESVAVYAFEEVEGEVRPREIIDREARDIDWATFSDVSDEVSNLFGRILRMKRGEDE